MPEPPRLRVLIVDDETHARERLRALLATERDVEIVGECANGREAVVAIRAQRPELVFLDVQMPGLTGFDVCEAVGAAQMPCVIFVTAHDQYAVDAFSVHAIDYLLKPFDEERFRKSLRHAREFLARDRAGGLAGDSDLESLLARLRAQAEPERRLALKTDGRVVLLRGEEVDWVEADGNYVKLHAGSTCHHVRETLTGIESQLPSGRFMRISRSVIVNLDRVRELQPMFYGDYVVLLRDGTRLTLSRGFRDRLDRLLRPECE